MNKKISDLKPDPRNANKHSEFGTSLLNRSLAENGAGRSILISSDDVIIAGNGVHEMAGQMGIENVRIIETDGTELIAVKRKDIKSGTAEFHKLAIADNIVALKNIVMDGEVVEGIAAEYEEVKFWSDLVGDHKPPVTLEDDYEIPKVIDTKIKRGDVFEIGQHRLMCGDSTSREDVTKLMNKQKADMVFTDPPYNIDYTGGTKKRTKLKNDDVPDFYKFLYDAYVNFLFTLKSGGAIYVAHADTERVNFTKAFLDAGFKLSSVIIWAKDNSTFGRSDYHWKHEPILYGWNANGAHKWFGDRKQDTLWEVKRPSRSDDHPTMKPIELIAKAINNSSKSDDLVTDLFLGSGSTMVAAHQLERKCYGMELDPQYCQVTLERMVKFDPEITIKKNGKITKEFKKAAK